MASTVTNLTKYFTESAAEALAYRLGNLNNYTYIVKKEGCYVNDYARVPYLTASAATVGTFSHDSGYPEANSYVNGVNVQMTDWLARPFDVTDSDAAHVTPEVMTRLASQAVNLLASDIESKLYTAASSSLTNYSASAAQWSANTGIVGLSTSASNARWRDDEKYWVVKPALYWKVGGNTDTLLANSFGSPTMIQNGIMTKYYGWNPVISDSIPSTVKGFGFTRDSLILATSLPTPQANNLLSLDTVSLRNGLEIQLVSYRDEPKRKTVYVAELITGYGVTGRGGYNLLSSDIA